MGRYRITKTLKDLIGLSPEICGLFGSDGSFLLVNRRMTDALGYPESELMSMHFSDMVHPDDLQAVTDLLNGVSLNQDINLFECRSLCRNGSYKWLSWNASYLAPKLIYASARDVTDVHKAKIQLKESEEEYKVLFYENPIPVIIYSLADRKVIDVNETAITVYGYSRREFLHMSIENIRPPQDVSNFLSRHANHIHDGSVRNYGVWRHLKKCGDIIQVEVVGNAIHYKGENCIIVAFKDITDKEDAIKSLQLSNERFEYVTEATSEIIWDWNLETDEVYYSANMTKLFGHTHGIRKNNLPYYFNHVHPEDRENTILYPDQVKYGNFRTWTAEYRFMKLNGEYAFIRDKGVVIRDENGVGLRMIGAMQDITTSKDKESLINEQNDRLTKIALITAHEIRRPAANILGLVKLIEKRHFSGENFGQVIEYIGREATDLDAIIKRIIDTSF